MADQSGQGQEPQQVMLILARAAAYVGCSERHLRRLIKAGKLRADREDIPGGFRYLIEQQALEEARSRGLLPSGKRRSTIDRQVEGGPAEGVQPPTPGQPEPAGEGVSGLRERLGAVEAERDNLRERLADYHAQLADYREREQRLFLLLDRSLPARLPGQADQATPSGKPQKQGLWARLFRRRR